MGEMHGARRVITFCLLTAVLPTVLLVIPLYLRHSLYADVSYSVAESDVLEAVEGISTVFCQEQILRMNSTFHAFQLRQMPPLSHQRKHIQLKKSMTLPDDTVEYWGFYLLAGSNISLLACSRFEGAGVLVVKGEKNLKRCESMEQHYKSLKYQRGSGQIKLPKTGSSREARTSQLKNPNLSQIDMRNRASLIHSLNYTNNQKTVKQEDDALDEFTKGLKEFITNYPNTKGTLKRGKNDSVEEEFKKQLSNHHGKSSLSTNHTRNGNANNSTKLIDHINPTIDTIDSSIAMKRKQLISLTKQLQNTEDDDSVSLEGIVRKKRKSGLFVTGHILDAGVGHGGNANVTDAEEESSDSSFEESLRKCYDGEELFSEGIYPTSYCHPNYSLNHLKVGTLQITSDGYYYFIFYSDNDNNENPIHAQFDLFKTTYQHTNFTRGCVNQTECKFPISFWSSEIVIVEVPTQDGIEHEDGDASVLISSCYPRMSIYAIFPVAVLFLILGCSFL